MILVMLWVAPAAAHAKPWVIKGNKVDEKALEKLREKYPSVETRNDLQNLLRDLAALTPIASAEATETDESYEISVAIAERIVRIDFHLVTRTFRTQLENLAQNYVGHIDSESVRQDLSNAIEKFLKDHGFPRPEISFSTNQLETGVRYRYKIDYGYPCLIEGISFGFAIPRELEFDVRPGDICDKDAIDAAITELDSELSEEGYNQARFDPPKYIYNAQTNTLKVSIGGELGKKIKYEIKDDKRGLFLSDLFSASELQDLDPALVSPEAMASDIKQRYQNRGYDDVVVSGPEIIKGDNDEQTYRYIVDPGAYYELTSVQFQGATALKTSELEDFFKPEAWFDTKRPLNPDLLQTGVDNLKNRYRELGYWDVEVREPRVSKNHDLGQAQVLVGIEEGIQRRFAGIQVRGATVFSMDKIKDMFDLDSGDPFNQAALLDFEKKVRETYLTEGYLYAEVFVNLEERSGLNSIFVTVNVTIDEGERVKIGDIQIIGLIDTKPKVVLRDLHFKTGEYYDPDAIDSSRRALLALGVFQSVQIIPADRNAATEREAVLDLVVEVKEAKPGNVSFGPGWSLLRGNRFTAESAYSNIGGLGRQIFARGQVSEEAHQKAIGPKTLIGRTLSIGYLEPYIFDWPINATASASNSARADDRWQLSTTGEVALTHKFQKYIAGSTLSTFYGQKINREESSEKERTGFLRLLGGSIRSGRVGFRYAWDHRNDITWPTSGFILNSEASRARFQYGGNLAYKYWQLSYSHYFALRPSTVIAVGFSMEAFQDVDRKGGEADVLPQSETLFVGGAETVRGFAERSLGPMIIYDQTERQVLGGSHSNYYKLELRQKVYSETTAISGFIDTGNVFFANQEIKNFDQSERNLKADDEDISHIEDNVAYQFEDVIRKPEYIWTKNYAAYGAAFNYLTPLGSINLAYGLPWKLCASRGSKCIERGEKAKHRILSGVFHINIGTSF